MTVAKNDFTRVIFFDDCVAITREYQQPWSLRYGGDDFANDNVDVPRMTAGGTT